jgi:hypothetical protein
MLMIVIGIYLIYHNFVWCGIAVTIDGLLSLGIYLAKKWL